MKKNKPLVITFHNPNTPEETIAELIKLSAELAKANLSDILIHIDKTKSVDN